MIKPEDFQEEEQYMKYEKAPGLQVDYSDKGNVAKEKKQLKKIKDVKD